MKGFRVKGSSARPTGKYRERRERAQGASLRTAGKGNEGDGPFNPAHALLDSALLSSDNSRVGIHTSDAVPRPLCRERAQGASFGWWLGATACLGYPRQVVPAGWFV